MSKPNYDLEERLREYSACVVRLTESMKRSRATNRIGDQLRDSRRWMRLIQRAALDAKPPLVDSLLAEAEQLIRIFAASIRTAEKKRESKSS